VLLARPNPFAMNSTANFEQVCLLAENPIFLEQNGNPGWSDFAGVAVPRGIRGLPATAVSRPSDSLTGGMPREHVLPGLMQMLSFGLHHAGEYRCGSTTLAMCPSYIEQRLSVPNFSPGATASTSGDFKPAILHKLFARDGMTFGKISFLDVRLLPAERILATRDERFSDIAFQSWALQSPKPFFASFRPEFRVRCQTSCRENQLTGEDVSISNTSGSARSILFDRESCAERSCNSCPQSLQIDSCRA